MRPKDGGVEVGDQWVPNRNSMGDTSLEEGQRFKQDGKNNADGGENRDRRTGDEHQHDKIFKAVAGPEIPW